MALGDNTNQNKNKLQERETYSRLRFYNASSPVDPSTIGISYLFGMMLIKFAPLMKNATPENPKYDYENEAKIFINHMDALILSQEIELFFKDPAAYQNVGRVNNGGSLLSVSNGIEYGVTTPCLVLRKIDESGDIAYTYIYQFVDTQYAIRNFDEKSKEYDKLYYDTAELIMFKITLDEYVKAMTAAMAYSINDTNRYAIAREDNRIQQIHDKLGIEKQTKGGGYSNGGGSNGKSLFDSKPGRSESSNDSSLSSIDDIKSLL